MDQPIQPPLPQKSPYVHPTFLINSLLTILIAVLISMYLYLSLPGTFMTTADRHTTAISPTSASLSEEEKAVNSVIIDYNIDSDFSDIEKDLKDL